MEILTDATLNKLLAECAKYENYVGAIFSRVVTEKLNS